MATKEQVTAQVYGDTDWGSLTREDAIELIAALDAARWGEAEREPSRRAQAPHTIGRLLNTLAHRPEVDFGDSAPPALLAAAAAKLTSADLYDLAQGG